MTAAPDPTLLTPRDEIKLHPAQQAAVDKAKAVRGPVWLQGDTGTGKTFTSICMAEGVELGVVAVHERNLGEQWVGSLAELGYKAVFVTTKADLPKLAAAMADDEVRWIVTTYNSLRRKELTPLSPEQVLAFNARVAAVKAYNAEAKKRDAPARRVPKRPRRLSAVSKALQAALVGKVSHLICDECQALNGLHKSPPSQRAKTMQWFVEKNFAPMVAAGDGDRIKVLFLSATPLTGRDTDLIGQYGIARLLPEIDHCIAWRYHQVAYPGGKAVTYKIPLGWLPDRLIKGPGVAATLERRRVRLSHAEMFKDVPPMTRDTWPFDIAADDEALLAAMLADEARPDDSEELAEIRYRLFRHAAVDGADADAPNDAVRGRWWRAFFELAEDFAFHMRTERPTIQKMKADTMPLYMFGCFLRSSMRLLLPAAAEKIAALVRHGKTIVFAEHYQSLAALAKHLPAELPYAYYAGVGQLDADGKRLTNDRIRANKDALRFGGLDLLLATYSKGGVGVEFTPAPHVVLAGRTANIAQMKQAEARIYRFNTRVPTWSFTCTGTINGKATRIERALSRIVDEKRARAERVGLAGTLG